MPPTGTKIRCSAGTRDTSRSNIKIERRYYLSREARVKAKDGTKNIICEGKPAALNTVLFLRKANANHLHDYN